MLGLNGRQSIAVIAGLLALGQSGLASAVEFHAVEMATTSNGYELVHEYHTTGLLGRSADNKHILLLDQDHNEDGPGLVRLLLPGMPFDSRDTQMQIAEKIADFPKECYATMSVNIRVAPIPGLKDKAGTILDDRRITNLATEGCAYPSPKECYFDHDDEDALDFGLDRMLLYLQQCRVATENALKSGDARILALDKHKKPERPAKSVQSKSRKAR